MAHALIIVGVFVGFGVFSVLVGVFVGMAIALGNRDVTGGPGL